MTDLSAEQNAMLERLCRKYFVSLDHLTTCICSHCRHDRKVLAALRELLLAVQEADAKVCDSRRHWLYKRGRYYEIGDASLLADAIRAQTYSDLFPEEK